MVDTLLTEACLQMDLRAIQAASLCGGFESLAEVQGPGKVALGGVQMVLNAESRLRVAKSVRPVGMIERVQTWGKQLCNGIYIV